MITFDYDGIALTHQKVTPGNTATALSAYCYKYKVYRINYDDQDTEITAGSWIVGATSSFMARVLYNSSSTTPNGTGYLLVDSWNGTAVTDDEEIKQAATATCANVNQPAAIVEATDAEYNLCSRLQWKDCVAKSALVVIYANTALVEINGSTPDQTALIGTPMVANASIKLRDMNEISGFKIIDYTAGSASIAQVDFFF